MASPKLESSAASVRETTPAEDVYRDGKVGVFQENSNKEKQ